MALHDITPRHREKGGGASIPLSGLQLTGLSLQSVAPCLTGILTVGKISVGYISMGRYICTHMRDKYSHTDMNLSLVSVHVLMITAWACTLVRRKTCCGP